MSETNNETIQQKTERLSMIIAWFDSDDFTLEESIAKFKQAEELAREIETDLTSLKNEVNVIKQRFEEES
ncbi:exodeoxyribonuclease VII small subunit [Candidatus Saccharibacteria bacterium]|nr:exodeoxyribonuclease VII small subunit [Candidatus Saccharibacteria bacterium]